MIAFCFFIENLRFRFLYARCSQGLKCTLGEGKMYFFVLCKDFQLHLEGAFAGW